jgi:C-terminal processing protease CtpA/Prc
MVKYLLSFILLFFFSNCRTSDKLTVTLDSNLSKQQVENLYVLAKVWGFIKYHHPVVAKGKNNFDEKLFKVLPPIAEATTTEKRNELLLNWINSLGDENKYDVTKEIPNDKDVLVKPSLSWLNDKTLFTTAVSEKLNNIYLHRNQGNNAYVKLLANLNPGFEGEDKYANMQAGDNNLQLLALFRYWNIIEYFYPSKYLIKENWDDVLNEFIPLFAGGKSILDYKLTCLKLINRIHDTHATITGDKEVGKYFGEKYSIARGRIIGGKLIVSSLIDMELAKEEPVQLGDEILTINNKTIAERRKEMEPLLCASNESVADRNFASYLLLRGNDDALAITYNHEGEIKTGKLKLYPLDVFNTAARKILSNPMYKFLNDSVGYITLANIQKSALKTIFETFKNTKGIVIDIRNYPADFVPFDLAYFLKPASSPFVKFSFGSISNPGLFTYTKPLTNGSQNSDYYKGKIVILVDEKTVSQAEYTTMALRTAPGAIVMGSQTAGADGDVSSVPFPGGFSSWISGLGVYYPDGKITQGVGIVPDIVVRPSQDGIKKGLDEVLERAIQYVLKGR